MIIKNGPLVVVLGAVVSVVAGGLGYYLSNGSLLVTLIAAAVPLFVCAVYANFLYLGFRRRAATQVLPVATPAPAAVPVAITSAVVAAAPIRRLAFLRSAFFYLTLGTLTLIWSGLWYWYLERHAPARDEVWYICHGLILTGLLLMLVAGLIYRAGQHVNPRRTATSGY